MRRKLPVLVLALIILLQVFVPSVYAASKNEVISSTPSFCSYDTTPEGAGNSAGIVTKNGIKIEGFTRHGVDRAIGDGFKRAGVKPDSILGALKNPLKTNNVVTDSLGRNSQRFIGKTAEVVINPNTGKIISVNPTSSSKAAKLLRELEGLK